MISSLIDSQKYPEVAAAISALGEGKIIVLADNENRENESDLICASDAVTAQQMAFIVRYTTGIVCVSLPKERCDALQIERLTPDLSMPDDQPQSSTAFAMPVDYTKGLTTGVSAAERAATANRLANSEASAGEFIRPGHIFPLIANIDGIAGRRGHTEASLEMVVMSGRSSGAVLSELVNDDGTMMRRDEAKAFALKYNLIYTTIDDLCEACINNP